MTILLGGLRVLGIGAKETSSFTSTVGHLTNDFFVNLLSMDTTWSAIDDRKLLYEGRDRICGRSKYLASSVDLLFGSHSVLRSLAEVYASDDYKEDFVRDFVAVWSKVITVQNYIVCLFIMRISITPHCLVTK